MVYTRPKQSKLKWFLIFPKYSQYLVHYAHYSCSIQGIIIDISKRLAACQHFGLNFMHLGFGSCQWQASPRAVPEPHLAVGQRPRTPTQNNVNGDDVGPRRPQDHRILTLYFFIGQLILWIFARLRFVPTVLVGRKHTPWDSAASIWRSEEIARLSCTSKVALSGLFGWRRFRVERQQ